MWCRGSRLTPPVLWKLRWSTRDRGSNESRALPHPEAVTSYQYFQSFWENRIVHKMDCGSILKSWAYIPTCHVLGKIIWTADTCYGLFRNILPVIKIQRVYSFHLANFVIFHQDMFIWKDTSTYCFGVRKNIYVSNNDYPSTIIIKSQRPGTTEQSSCRKAWNTALVWLAPGTRLT